MSTKTLLKRTAFFKIGLFLGSASLLTLTFPTYSQTRTSSNNATGIITDSLSKHPIAYVTVNLKDDKKQRIKVAATSTDGKFVFSNLVPGNYVIDVVSLEYHPKTVSFSILQGNGATIDLGTVLMTSGRNTLKEVTVTADRPIVKQESDKIIYDLIADPESKGRNVLDMMRKVPLLSVDGEDNVLLKGSGGYKILVDGRPSNMIERNPKDILRSMPASTIKSIEVFTTPPAKYDSEGLAGIINIVTNKQIGNGYNATLNVNTRFPVGGPAIGATVASKTGKVGWSILTGANLYRVPASINSGSRLTQGSTPTSLIQQLTRTNKAENAYFGGEMSFEPNSLHLISAQVYANASDLHISMNQQSILTGNNTVLQRYDLQNRNEGGGNGIDASLNYQLGFKNNRNRFLTFSYRYGHFGTTQNNILTASNPINYSDPDYRQSNKGQSSEQTFQVDYIQPLKQWNMEAGIKTILRNNNSDFQYLFFNVTDGQYTLDPARTNKFNNDQDVIAAYNSYQFNSQKIGFKAGVRIEKTIINSDFISVSSQLRRNYLNVTPSLSLLLKLKNQQSITLGVSQRLQRPGINQLNPFVDRSNPNFEVTGNPDLRPTIGTDIRLNYTRSKKGNVSIGMGFMSVEGMIMPIYYYKTGTSVTTRSFANVGSSEMLNTNLSVNYPITGKWSMSGNGNFSHGKLRGTVNGLNISNDGFMYNGILSSGYNLEKGWRVNASVNIVGRPNLSLQSQANTFVGTSLGVTKDILKDKLSFSAAITNPFTKFQYNRIETFGPDFTQLNTNQMFFRSFSATLNYHFGKLKEAVKKTRRNISNDDLTNAQ